MTTTPRPKTRDRSNLPPAAQKASRINGEKGGSVGKDGPGMGCTETYTIKVPPLLKEFLAEQGPDEVRKKLKEWHTAYYIV